MNLQPGALYQIRRADGAPVGSRPAFVGELERLIADADVLATHTEPIEESAWFVAHLSREENQQLADIIHHPDGVDWLVFDGMGEPVTFDLLKRLELAEKPCCNQDKPLLMRLVFSGVIE